LVGKPQTTNNILFLNNNWCSFTHLLIQGSNITITHPQAAVGNWLTNQLLFVGAMEPYLMLSIRPKADPAIA
jgi:hypothetical protein